MGTASLLALLMLAVAAMAAAFVLLTSRRHREGFEPYRTYGQRETEDYYGVPLHFMYSGDGDGSLRCDPNYPDCPSGMRCSPDGFCLFECGPDGSCPNGLVCGPDGLCIENPCPEGFAPDAEGVCRHVCNVDGDCPAGQECVNGLCACSDTCTGESVRAPGADCACECQEGYAFDPDGECRVACSDVTDCPSGTTCVNGVCVDDECPEGYAFDADRVCRLACSDTADCPSGTTCVDGVCVEDSDDGDGESNGDDSTCLTAWPVSAAAVLINGNVVRLYNDTLPCRYKKVFSAPMRHRLDFVQHLRRCVRSGRCDGLALCDSTKEAVGFSFKERGGKTANKRWYGHGNATFLKEGTGNCGPFGKPVTPGRCLGLDRLADVMSVDQRFGGAVFPDHRPCNMQTIPFRRTGLKDFNFVRADVMLVRDDADAGLCHQLCKQDVRCDAVEISDTECSMYHRLHGVAPSLRAFDGIRTVFVNHSPELALTRAQVLRSMGDPADHSTGDVEAPSLPPLPDLYLRVWDQRSEEHGYTENLTDDGLHPDHEYFVTLEGSGALADTPVTVKWIETRAKNVYIHRKTGGTSGGFVPLNVITHISFTADRLGRLNEALWLENSGGNRSLPFVHPHLADNPAGPPHGTLTTFKNNTLDVVMHTPPDVKRFLFGQIVYRGAIAQRETHDRMPTAADVLQALQLDGIQVTKSGAMFTWRPVSLRPSEQRVEFKRSSATQALVSDLAMPGLGGGSQVVVYAGETPGDMVPVSRVVSKGTEAAAPPPPAPDRYDAWFVSYDDLQEMEGATVPMENPSPARCARECDTANVDGEPACTVFRVTAGGCELANWEVDGVANARWSDTTQGVVYRREGSNKKLGDTVDAADQTYQSNAA